MLPQILARIQIADEDIRESLHSLLLQIGRIHPQVLVFPLTVAASSKSSDRSRQLAASYLLNKLTEHSSQLVHEAAMVSAELIRVAVLWNEMWHEGLEEASKLYTDQVGGGCVSFSR